MATGGKQRDTRAERERVRVYQARQAFHAGQSRRRTRDNLIAGIGGGLLILAVVAGQTAYFTVGPGAPVPTPTPTTTPSPSVTPAPSVTPTTTPEPSGTPDADAQPELLTLGGGTPRPVTDGPPVLGWGRPSPTGGESRDEVHLVTAAAESTPESTTETTPENPDAQAPDDGTPVLDPTAAPDAETGTEPEAETAAEADPAQPRRTL